MRPLAAPKSWSFPSFPSPAIRRAIWSKSPPSSKAASANWTAWLAKRRTGLSVICGYVARSEAETGKRALNRAALIERGEIVFRQSKMLLPNYDVFDEARYFRPAEREYLCTLRGTPVALTICEDAWNDRRFWKERLYQRDPVEELFEAGAQMLICINASPYNMGKRAIRRSIYRAAARRYAKPVIYVNQVGGNDQLVFDGTSFAMNSAGEVIAAARSFEEDLILCDLDAGTGDRHEDFADECEAAYQALVLGTRDYIRKCGFSKVLIGLSGGIDSALTAVIAVDAVGKENVTGVGMPGPYSSESSVTDARDMAEKLGIRFEIVSITGAYERFEQELAPLFQGTAARRHRREPAIATARRHADGSLQQDRSDGAHHRQQERTRRGLLHSLRRYVRRLGGDQRRPQDLGVQTGAHRRISATMEPFRKACSPSRLPPSCAPIKRIPIPCPPTMCWIRFSKPTSSNTARPARSRPA